jgi:hypothetical protein
MPPLDGEPLVSLESESAIEDVAGDVGGAAAGGVRAGPQSDQRLGRLDLELRHEHSGGLADLGAGQRIEFRPGVAGGVGDGGLQVGVEEVQQWNACEFGRGDATGHVVGRQLAWLMAEKVKGADVLARDDEGHGVHAANVLGQQGRTERGPATVGGIGQVDDVNGLSLGDGVQARALAEGELQFVVPPGRRATGTKGPGRSALEDQRNGRGVDVEKHDAGIAEAVRGVDPSMSVDRREQLLLDRHASPFGGCSWVAS